MRTSSVGGARSGLCHSAGASPPAVLARLRLVRPRSGAASSQTSSPALPRRLPIPYLASHVCPLSIAQILLQIDPLNLVVRLSAVRPVSSFLHPQIPPRPPSSSPSPRRTGEGQLLNLTYLKLPLLSQRAP